MTEAMTTTPTGAEERPRCGYASRTDHPCWREATTAAHFDPKTPRYCPEHVEVMRLGARVEELLCHLDKLGEWITTWDDPSEGETRLQYHSFTMRKRLVEELWRATVEAEAADLIAMQRPEETPLTLEQAERLAESWAIANVLSDAAAIIEDLQAIPEHALGGRSRWQTAGALHAAINDASAEQERLWAELKAR